MSKTLHLEIVNPSGIAYRAEVGMVIARAINGEMGVLPGHCPLIALLEQRHIRVLTEGDEQQIMVQGGILQVKPNSEVIILTNG